MIFPAGGAKRHGWPAGVSHPGRCAALLRDEGPTTVTELARRTGISRPTVDAVLADLLARGLVLETADRTRGGRGAGRPAKLYAFNERWGFLVGVDIGSHTVRVTVAQLAGRVVGWADVPVEPGASARIDTVVSAIRAAMRDAAVPDDGIVAMGVALPGIIDDAGRVVVSHVMPDWQGTDLPGLLREEFDCPVRVENDLRLAALAEHRIGAAQDVDDVLCLFVGHRISMGLILGGRIRRGHHGAAGEVGDVLLGDRADATGELRWRSAGSAAAVFTRAADGDAESMREVERFAADLSVGLGTLAMGIDPDLIVIGGGVSRAGDALLDPLRAAVNARITVPAYPKIVASNLGAGAVALGALVRACAESSSVTGLPEPSLDVHEVAEHLDGLPGTSAERMPQK